MERFSKKDQFLVGLTLFSMFFGAGNLIFPPILASQAGNATWPAMLGMALSAVGLPVLGVVAVAKAGGLKELSARVHPLFAEIFAIVAYLSIGPGLAIPRTATTSFEMAVTPFVPSVSLWMRAAYSLVFFGVATAVALRPEQLTKRLGKITGPVLLVLICVITAACLVKSPGGYGPATGAYAVHPISQGFLDGYQTMDTIAALNFGIVIVLNIRERGLSDDKKIMGATIKAGWIAGAILLVVYVALAHVGAVSGGMFPGAENGAQVLTNIVSWLFGPVGSALLGVVFVIACFNTCTGLLSSCSEYFCNRFHGLSYRGWLFLFAGASFVTSIAGLNAILAVSVPVLGIIYPVAIVIIVLGLAHRWTGKVPRAYPRTTYLTLAASVFNVLDTSLGVTVPGLTALFRAMPLYDMGLGWIVPAVAGFALGAVLSRGKKG